MLARFSLGHDVGAFVTVFIYLHLTVRRNIIFGDSRDGIFDKCVVRFTCFDSLPAAFIFTVVVDARKETF